MAKFMDAKVLPQEALDRFKHEVAAELGIPLRDGDNGDLRARDAGRIGGRIGGSIVKVLIRRAEQQLAGSDPLA